MSAVQNVADEARLVAKVIRETLEGGQTAYAFTSTADLLDALVSELARTQTERDKLRDALQTIIDSPEQADWWYADIARAALSVEGAANEAGDPS